MNIEGEESETIDREDEVIEGDVVVEDGETPSANDDDAPLIVQFGDEEPEEDDAAGAPEWVKDLRKANREQAKRIKELEASSGAAKPDKLGPKPTRADFDYDDDAYDAALNKWYEDKVKHDAEVSEAEKQQQEAAKAWQARLDDHTAKKAVLAKRAPDLDEAEAFVLDTFDTTQQAILIDIADDSAVLGYALFKNPTKAKELAAERSHPRFTKRLALLEATMKTGTRKPPPPADKDIAGSGGTGGAVDGELERLRAEAEKTGDLSKVLAYKRQHRK